MNLLGRYQLGVVFLWADHRNAAALWIFVFLVLSKVDRAQVLNSEVPNCWFYRLHLHSVGQVFWSWKSVQLCRSQHRHNKCGNSGLWLCPLRLTTALKVWPSFTKCETSNKRFFRHRFISWLLKPCLGIWRGDPWILQVRMFEDVLRTCFWQMFGLLFAVIEVPRSGCMSNLDQMGTGEGAALSSWFQTRWFLIH